MSRKNRPANRPTPPAPAPAPEEKKEEDVLAQEIQQEAAAADEEEGATEAEVEQKIGETVAQAPETINVDTLRASLKAQGLSEKLIDVTIKALSSRGKYSRECGCGCKGITKGGNYLPGHDAKHMSRILKEERERLAASPKVPPARMKKEEGEGMQPPPQQDTNGTDGHA